MLCRPLNLAITSIRRSTVSTMSGLLPDEMRRLKQLEDENARLKRIVANLTLDRQMVAV